MKLAIAAAAALAAVAFAPSAGAATLADSGHHNAGAKCERKCHTRPTHETCAQWKREHRHEPGREPSPAICFVHGD